MAGIPTVKPNYILKQRVFPPKHLSLFIYLFLVLHAYYGLMLSLTGTQALFVLNTLKPRTKSKKICLSSMQPGVLTAALSELRDQEGGTERRRFRGRESPSLAGIPKLNSV